MENLDDTAFLFYELPKMKNTTAANTFMRWYPSI